MVNNVTALVGAFVAVAIMLSITVVILANAGGDCTTLDGYNATSEADSTGWAGECVTTNTQTQAAFGLLIVVLVVIAAVVILQVVKLL